MSRRDETHDPVEAFSPRLQRAFGRYLRYYFGRNFNAVRISRAGEPTELGTGSTLFYSNHPSWWDPILLLLLGAERYPGREAYGPIEAQALSRYALLARLGLFGVEQGTRAGAAAFLRATDRILTRPGAILCITAEGRFADPRMRPLRLQPGLAHVARRHPDVPVVPIAIEYPFWDERRPEALVRFGDPVRAPGQDVPNLLDALRRGLERTMDALADEARSRDASAFQVLLEGRKGVGGLYDTGRRIRAWVSGKPFHPEHVPRDAERET